MLLKHILSIVRISALIRIGLMSVLLIYRKSLSLDWIDDCPSETASRHGSPALFFMKGNADGTITHPIMDALDSCSEEGFKV